jgi:hypothetical protein
MAGLHPGAAATLLTVDYEGGSYGWISISEKLEFVSIDRIMQIMDSSPLQLFHPPHLVGE